MGIVSTQNQTEYLKVNGGQIAYTVMGNGPLIILSPGMADTRDSYRFLAPLIANAGYKVVSVDLRGHGESSIEWGTYTHTDTAEDLIAVIKKLGGPAVIVGQSFSGGAATLAAASYPSLISAIIEIDPFTRPPKTSLSAILSNKNKYRSGMLPLGRFIFTGNIKAWSRYLEVAYPGRKPADWNVWLAALQENLRQPGRVKAAQKMANSKATIKEAAKQLPKVTCPVLVVMGSKDSDFPDPQAEASEIVGLLPAGLGSYKMIDGAGHYPHAQYPQEVANAMLPFLGKVTHA